MDAVTAPDHSVRDTLEAVRRLVRALRRGAQRAEHAAGLSTAELFILHALGQGPVRSLNELAARTFTDQSSASPVVSRLQRRRLLRRTRSPEDGRRVVIELTRAGDALLARSPRPPQQTLVAALERLPLRDRHALARELTRLTTEMGLAGEPATMLFEELPAAIRSY
jgi:DNA-binding MarR family transcriptional regulator